MTRPRDKGNGPGELETVNGSLKRHAIGGEGGQIGPHLLTVPSDEYKP